MDVLFLKLPEYEDGISGTSAWEVDNLHVINRYLIPNNSIKDLLGPVI